MPLSDLGLVALKRELVTSSLVAEIGWSQLEALASYLKSTAGLGTPDEVIGLEASVLAGVQLVLSSASMVSRLLWPFQDAPPRGAKQVALDGRSRDFRSAIGVGDASPLKGRDVRNEHVHVENSVVEWLETHPADRPAAFGFGDGSVTADGPGPEGCFRYWNYVNGSLKVGKYSCNVRELVDELRALRMKVPMTWSATILTPKGRLGAPSPGTRHYTRANGHWVLREE